MSTSAVSAAAAPAAPRLENAALVAVCLFAGALQLSIGAAAALLTLTLGLWVGVLIGHRERFDAPAMFWPLLAYAGVTLVSVAASLQPMTSLVDSKEVLLFLVVPVVYRFARGSRASTVATVVISIGAVTAVFGIVQYGILEYDSLGQRPRGSMGHYMTYSGLLMLVMGLAAARLLFGRTNRVWAALVLPALVVALTLTLTRSAWVGACTGIGLLLVIRDRRLLAAIPVVAAIFFALAPPVVTDRPLLHVRSTGPHESGPFRNGKGGRTHDPRPSPDRCRTGHGAGGVRGLPRRRRCQRGKPPPPQRPAAHRGRARAASARDLAVVRRGRGP